MVVDEADKLVTKYQKGMVRLINWNSLKHAKFHLIFITNSSRQEFYTSLNQKNR